MNDPAITENEPDGGRDLAVLIARTADEKLADDIVVLKEGRIETQGAVFDVLSDPAHIQAFGVQDAGAVLPAILRHHTDDGLSVIEISAGTLTLPKVDAVLGRALRLRVRAQDVSK